MGEDLKISQSRETQGHNALAGKGLEFMKAGSIADYNAPPAGKGDEFTEWQASRKCDSVEQALWLYGESTTSGNTWAKVAATALSRMTQSEINQCADLLPKSSFYTEKDKGGNVSRMGYLRDIPNFINPVKDPIASVFLDPGLAAFKIGQGIYNKFADDASVSIKDGKAIFKANHYFDLTDQGYWSGSNQIRVPLRRTEGQ